MLPDHSSPAAAAGATAPQEQEQQQQEAPAARRESCAEGEGTGRARRRTHSVIAQENGQTVRAVSASFVEGAPEDPVRTQLIYTFGARSVLDSSSALVPIEQALAHKAVALLLTSKSCKDPVLRHGERETTFLRRLSELAHLHREGFAVLYVSIGPEDDVGAMLAEHSGFFALPHAPASTRETLAGQCGFGTGLWPFTPTAPALVVLSDKHEVLTRWGRSAVLCNGDYCVIDWKRGRPGLTLAHYLGGLLTG